MRKLALIILLVFRSLPACGIDCGNALAAMAAGDMKTALEILHPVKDQLTPEQKLEIAAAFVSNAGNIDPANLLQIMHIAGPDAMAHASNKLNRDAATQVATFAGTNKDIAHRTAVATNASGSDAMGFLMTQSHVGARALAFRALKDANRFRTSMETFMDEHRGDDGKYRGVDGRKLQLAYQVAATDSKIVAAVQEDDKVFKKLFEGRQDLYDGLAHSPFLLPYLLVHHMADAETAQSPMGRDTESLMRAVVERRGLGNWEDVKKYLADRMKNTSVESTILGHIGKRMQDGRSTTPGNSVPDATVKGVLKAEDIQKVYAHAPTQEELTETLKKAVDGAALRQYGFSDGPMLSRIALMTKEGAHAFGHFVRGNDETARKILATLAAPGNGRPGFGDAQVKWLEERLHKLAQDVTIQRAYEAAGTGQGTIEMRFLGQLGHFTDTVPMHGMDMSLFNFSPQHVEMAKVVGQYGSLIGRDGQEPKVLEVGYELPAVLGVVGMWNVKAHGIDVKPVPAKGSPSISNLTLWQGNAPKDATVTQEVNGAGPYAVIYGLDTFKKLNDREKFDAGVSGTDYLKWVKQNLEPGGRFIALNTQNHPFAFSEAEVEAAGLRVLRWNSKRPLPQRDIELFKIPKGNQEYDLYILQNGDEAPTTETKSMPLGETPRHEASDN